MLITVLFKARVDVYVIKVDIISSASYTQTIHTIYIEKHSFLKRKKKYLRLIEENWEGFILFV
jgi:hypothetical protein